MRYLVIEKGALVNSLLNFPHDMVFFTTPELLEIGGMPFVSPYEKPTRQESLRYYRRVTDAFELNVVLGEEVRGITRRRDGIFVIATPGVEREARAVVIATGA